MGQQGSSGRTPPGSKGRAAWRRGLDTNPTQHRQRPHPLLHLVWFPELSRATRLTNWSSLTISFPGVHRNTPEKEGELCGARVWNKNNGHVGRSSAGLSLPGGTCTACSYTLSPRARGRSRSESGSPV